MPGIVLNTTFSDATMPVGTSLAAAVIAISDLTHWFQADADHVTAVSGDISVWADRKGSGKTLGQTTAAKRATLTANAIAGYSAASFSTTSSAQYLLSGAVLPWTGPHTIVACAKLPSVTTANNMLLGANSTNSWFLGRVGSGIFRFRCGGNAEVSGVAEGEWNLFVASYDGTATVKLGVNGGSPAIGAASDPTVIGSTVVSGISEGGGGYWNGLISDVMVFDGDLHASSREVDLAKVISYFRGAYGVGA